MFVLHVDFQDVRCLTPVSGWNNNITASLLNLNPKKNGFGLCADIWPWMMYWLDSDKNRYEPRMSKSRPATEETK